MKMFEILQLLLYLRDFWKRTSSFQKRTMLVYLKTCAPLLLIQSCLLDIHLPTWRTKHTSELSLSTVLSTNKFSLVIHVQFSQHKVRISKSTTKCYPVYKIVWIIGGVKILSTVEQSWNENIKEISKSAYGHTYLAQKYRIVIINEKQTNKKKKNILLSIILTLTIR